MRYRLTIPAADGVEVVRSFVVDWINHPALRALVADAGGPLPVEDPVVDVAQLARFSDRWNFRGGSERLDARGGETALGDDAIMEAGAQLGMTLAQPPADVSYDHVLVLGGTARASRHRIERLYDLRASGIAMNATAVLTALRPLCFNELDGVPAGLVELQEGLDTEFALMVRLVERQTGAPARVTLREHAVSSLRSAIATVGDVTVLAAPSSIPGGAPTPATTTASTRRGSCRERAF